jgi:ATP-binding cassette, subfamily A (ABC1), member 3
LFSGGNKRKLTLGIGLIGKAPILLFDEPSRGVDPEARRAMWNLIHGVSSESNKSAVILTTHSMEEAQTLSSKIGININIKL